jgi:hypothetical protein
MVKAANHEAIPADGHGIRLKKVSTIFGLPLHLSHPYCQHPSEIMPTTAPPRNFRFVPPNACFGTRIDHFGTRTDRFGLRNDHFGLRTDHFGTRTDHFGPHNDHFGPRNDHFGPRTCHFGPRTSRFGRCGR